MRIKWKDTEMKQHEFELPKNSICVEIDVDGLVRNPRIETSNKSLVVSFDSQIIIQPQASNRIVITERQ